MSTYRDPELDSIFSAMVKHRNLCEATDMGHWARAMDDAIEALKRHPYFEDRTRAALAELADLGQEIENPPPHSEEGGPDG